MIAEKHKLSYFFSDILDRSELCRGYGLALTQLQHSLKVSGCTQFGWGLVVQVKPKKLSQLMNSC